MQFFTFVPKILLGIVISFLDEVYYKVAKWLNDKGILVGLTLECFYSLY